MAYPGGHQRREQLARAKGFASYREYRKASAPARSAATTRAAAVGAYQTPATASQARQQVARATPTAPITTRQRRFDLGGGDELVRTMNERELVAALRRADDNDKVVRAVVTVRLADGTRRTYTLWQKGGWHGANAYAAAQAFGAKDMIADAANNIYDDGIGGADILAIDLSISDD